MLDAAAGVRRERAVAASRAVPVLLPQITVAGRRCIDGALGSATSADVLADSAAARVIVITPVPADPPPVGRSDCCSPRCARKSRRSRRLATA